MQKGIRFSVVPAANEGKVLRAQGEEEQLKRLTEILQIRRTVCSVFFTPGTCKLMIVVSDNDSTRCLYFTDGRLSTDYWLVAGGLQCHGRIRRGIRRFTSKYPLGFTRTQADLDQYHISAMNESSASQARRLLLIAGLRVC